MNGTPEVVPVTETAPIQPESVYAESKAMVERILHWYGQTSDLRSVSLRYFNAAGASFDGRIGEDWTHSQNLVPLAMKALLLKDRRLSVFGDDYDTPDGTCIRDYIHVADLADAHVKSLAYLGAGGDTVAVNVGTGIGSSVLDVLNATAAAPASRCRTTSHHGVPATRCPPTPIRASPRPRSGGRRSTGCRRSSTPRTPGTAASSNSVANPTPTNWCRRSGGAATTASGRANRAGSRWLAGRGAGDGLHPRAG